MKTSAVLLLVFSAIACAQASPGVPPQNPERVREIAAMLPEKPGFPSVTASAAGRL